MSRYYIADGMVQRGPFEMADLPGQGIRADSLVWKEGMPQWRRADGVEELIFAGVLGQAMPPPPYAPAATGPGLSAPASQLGYANPFPQPPPFNPASSNRVAAGLCGILLGGFGVHKFILGMPTPGIIMLLLSLVGGFVTCGISSMIVGVIGLIEGIIYLTRTEEQFYHEYVVRKKSWF